MYSFSYLEPVCCPVLTVASWPAYRFLKRQVRWSGIPISWRIFQFVVVHTVKGFGIVNKAEIDVFLELFCFFNDPTDVGNLISGSSAFSKSSWTSRSFALFCCVNHNKMWKILKEMGIPDHLTWLLRNVQVKKQQLELDNRLVPNQERSMSRLYIVTLLI